MAYPAYREGDQRLFAPLVERGLGWVWKQVSYHKNRRLVIVFLLYLTNILAFAKMYDFLYRHSLNTDPGRHFAFGADILQTRNEQARYALGAELDNAKRAARILSELQDTLAELSSAPKPKPLGTFQYVEFKVEAYSCEFDLAVSWRYGSDGKIMLRNGLIIEDETGRRLLNRDVEIMGPKDSKPRSPEVQNWIDLQASGQDINLYRQMTAVALQDALRDVTALDARLPPPTDTKPRYWSFWDFVYFSTISQTTVGYGDILPNSTTVRMLVCVQVLIGLVLVGFALTFAFRPSS